MDIERTSNAPVFGRLLRRHRLAAGLSQEALAERARVSSQGIGALERGERRTPQRETLSLLIEALELGPEQRAAFEVAALRRDGPRSERGDASVVLHPAALSMLPVALTSFVGRDAEVEELCRLVLEQRLVTLTGPGGIGKTRVALDVARAISEAFPAGVRFVELAMLRDPKLVVSALVASFNLPETQVRSPLDTLLAHLRQKRILLIVDNCEHVVAEVAVAAESLLRACPLLTMFATSRERLRVPGEFVYRLPSLPAPALDDAGRLDAARAAEFPAIRLFAERARSVDRTFVLDDDRAPVVAEICAHLDGIPLAIELAAARVAALSLPALAANLRRQFTLLGGGGRLAHSRQQTMRATFDWSFDLLGEPERRLFASLAVFVGGFTIEAAARVACGANADEVDTLDGLSSLVDKSLVVADLGGNSPRYRLLEPFRQYAYEKLVERGELATMSQRHAVAFSEIAERLLREVRLHPEGHALAAARADVDNWRAALEWCLVARNDVSTGQRLAADLRVVWTKFAVVEGRRWARLALEAAGSDSTPVPTAAMLERIDANFSATLGEFEVALAAARRAVAQQSKLDDGIETARAELEIGYALLRLGRPSEAEPPLRAALANAVGSGGKRLTAKILYIIAEMYAALGDFEAARTACVEAHAAFPVEKGEMEIVSLNTRAEIEFRAGDADAAVRFASEGLDKIEHMLDSEKAEELESALRANVSAYLVSLGRYDDARIHARGSLDIANRMQFMLEHVWALQHLAAISVLRAEHGNADAHSEEIERAATLIGFVEKRYAELGGAIEPTERQELERVLGMLPTLLPVNRLTSLRTRGAAFGDDEATAEALLV